MSQLSQIQDLQLNSLSDSREFHGPETTSSFLNGYLLEKGGLRPDIPGNTMVPEREVRREAQNSSIFVPHF